MIEQAVAAGKPALVEKPLTRTLDEAVRLVERIESSGVKVGVNYQYRYDAGCYRLAMAVQAGELGKIHSARINVPWRREAGYFAESAWHQTLATAGGGTLITQGSHFLDVVLWALGERPVAAMGFTAHPGFEVEVETLAHGIVETSGGALIQIASTMAAAREQPATIEVYGERATACYRASFPPRVRFYGASVRAQPPVPVNGLHALQRSLAGFAAWVCHNRPFLIPAAEALPVLSAVDAIYRSAQSGKKEILS
jgi:predicted dehydrogenase